LEKFYIQHGKDTVATVVNWITIDYWHNTTIVVY
jgi:hypothetical protein